MVNQFPYAIFSKKNIGSDQEGIVHVLVADDVCYVSVYSGRGGVARDLRCVRAVKDRFPTLHDVVATRERSPAWVNASDRRPLRPQILHGFNVSIVKGQIEGLVGEKNGGIIGQG